MVNLIWCPYINDEMGSNMASFISAFPYAHRRRLEGGKKELGAFDPLTYKLYILAHGHEQMPVFSIKPHTWTPKELVALLYSDGLPTTWREIELLVCFAGASVNTTKIGDKLLGIRQNMLDLRAQGVDREAPQIKQLSKKFDVVAAKGQDPSQFTSDAQLVPLAGQFVQALKNHTPPYTHFRVISYAARVAQNFSEGQVTLDVRRGKPKKRDKGWGEPLSKHPDKIKIWH